MTKQHIHTPADENLEIKTATIPLNYRTLDEIPGDDAVWNNLLEVFNSTV